MDNLTRATAANVRRLMVQHRTTQLDVARVLGIRQSQVSRRLSGAVPFRLPELELLAERFQTSADELVKAAPAEPTSAVAS